MVFEANYAKVKTVFHSMAPLNYNFHNKTYRTGTGCHS